jgi:hypothetical protein
MTKIKLTIPATLLLSDEEMAEIASRFAIHDIPRFRGELENAIEMAHYAVERRKKEKLVDGKGKLKALEEYLDQALQLLADSNLSAHIALLGQYETSLPLAEDEYDEFYADMSKRQQVEEQIRAVQNLKENTRNTRLSYKAQKNSEDVCFMTFIEVLGAYWKHDLGQRFVESANKNKLIEFLLQILQRLCPDIKSKQLENKIRNAIRKRKQGVQSYAPMNSTVKL